MKSMGNSRAISKWNYSKNQMGQTAIELLLILSVCVVALAIIYSLYSQQINLSNTSKELITSKNTIQRLVNTANTLSLSGANSRSKVWIDLPTSLQMSGASITGRAVSLKLSNGTDIFATADVNFLGDWKKRDGNYITGGYYANLVFNGSVVEIFYDDFELSNESIYISAKQGSITQKSFTVRNNSSSPAIFLISSNFSHSPFAFLLIESSDIYFSLDSGESKVIDFNVVLSSSASGNFASSISVVGQINDSGVDTNITKSVSVSVESFLEIKELMAYPSSNSFSSFAGVSTAKTFSMCNTSSNIISGITWSKDGNVNANASEWFSLPEITSIGASQCESFDLNITVPVGTQPMLYDSNITVHYNDINSYTIAYLYVNVINPLVPSSLFFSVTQNNFPNNYLLSSFVAQRNDDNAWVTNGELDWNYSARNDYVNSLVNGELRVDNNIFGLFDSNLVGLWHLNEPSGTTFVDSSGKDHNGTGINFSGDEYVSGLWGTNNINFDDSNNYISVPSSTDFSTLTSGEFTYSAWIKSSDYNIKKVILSRRHPCNNDAHFNIYVSSNRVYLGYYSDINSVGIAIYSGQILTNGQLYHIVFTRKWGEATTKLYVNGISQTLTGDSATNGSTYSGSSYPLFIGAQNSGGSCGGPVQDFFKGTIEEVGIWDRRLSENEVRNLYTIQKGSWVDQNLISYYKFNEYTGTRVFDSARGYGGTLTGGATVRTGLWDTNSLSLDGSNDYVNVGSIGNVTNGSMTFSAWILRDENGARDVVFGNYNGSNNVNLEIYSDNYVRVWWNNGEKDYKGTYQIPANQWVLYTVVRDTLANKFYSYINGELKNTFDGAGTNIVSTASFYVGKDTRDGTTAFKGLIDEVKIYDRALSGTEILADYNSWLGNKFVDSNIFDANSTADWDLIRVNKTAGYKFGKEIEDWNTLKSMGINELGSSADSNYLYSDQNLLALWHFNNNMTDVFGLSNGTTAGVFVDGLFDSNGHYCNGTNIYAFTNTSSRLNKTQFTFNAWVKSDYNLTAGGKSFYTHAGGNGYSASFRVFHDSLNQRFNFAWGSGTAYDGTIYTKTGSAPNYTWNMLTATYDGSEMKIYANGVYQSKDSSVLYGYASTAGGHFCRCDGCTMFKGSIDEISFFDKPLTDNEISDLYDSQKPMFQNSLVGLWHLNNDLNDASGNGYNGSWNGTGDYDSGLWDTNAGLFGGSSDISVSGTESLDFNIKVSISLWAKTNSSASQTIICKGGSTTTQFCLDFIGSSLRWFGYDSNATVKGTISANPNIFDGKWHHIVTTFDGTYWKIYYDGSLVRDASSAATLVFTNNPIKIGGRLFATTYFNGKLEEVAVWDRVLSATEAKELYRKGVSKLDLNVYSCSDVTCNTRTGSEYISDANNGLWTSLGSGVKNSRYLGVDAFFRPSTSFADENAPVFWTGAFLKDFNVFFYK